MSHFSKMIKDEARLYWDEILAVILDFHIRLYEQFLSKFNTLFASVDQDSDGTLNEFEFNALMQKMQEDRIWPVEDFDTEADRLLEVVDPQCNQRITHTELV